MRAVKAWAVIGVVGVWLIGYFLMGRLDRLLARVRPEAGAAEERPPAPREPDAPLLFCGHDEQARALSNALTGCLPGLQTLHMAELPAHARPRAVIALLPDDADNLLLCVQAMRLRGDCLTIALCGDRTCASLFQKARVVHVLLGAYSAQAVLNIIQGGRSACIDGEKA